MIRSISAGLRWLPVASLALGCAVFTPAQAPAAAPTQPAPLPVLIASAEPGTPPDVSSSLAEAPSGLPVEPAALEASDSALPDAPSARVSLVELPEGFDVQGSGQATPNVAPKLIKYIPAGMTAQPITAHDKVLIGLHDLYSPLNFVAMIASAGYEQASNGAPNYGTDRGAFGQRLGAAAIRESTQGIFTDIVFSPLLHEDPRYFTQGNSHSFFYRTGYAVSRVLVTRTDNGNSSVNGALLLGYASSAALGYTYYPAINQNFRDTASSFGGSLGGAALGFFVSEFSDDFFKAIHLKK